MPRTQQSITTATAQAKAVKAMATATAPQPSPCTLLRADLQGSTDDGNEGNEGEVCGMIDANTIHFATAPHADRLVVVSAAAAAAAAAAATAAAAAAASTAADAATELAFYRSKLELMESAAAAATTAVAAEHATAAAAASGSESPIGRTSTKRAHSSDEHATCHSDDADEENTIPKKAKVDKEHLDQQQVC